MIDQRQQIVQDLGYLSLRLKHSIQPGSLDNYKKIANFFKTQDNIFLLSKGTGRFVADFIAQKFNQIACIHAEAYPSAEFRHGPLAMLDEDEKTAVIFLILDDENLDQCLMNILQVKERGATVTVVTNLKDIGKVCDASKIDFLIQIFPQ